MTIGVDDLEPEPEPEPVPGQDVLGPLPEVVPLPEPPAFVPLDVPPFLPLPEVDFLPLPEPDVAETLAHLAREADELLRFVAEYAARRDDPRELAELLAGIAERDAEAMRWVGGP